METPETAFVVAVANDIIQGDVDPYLGAKRLWQTHEAVEGPHVDLLTFIGLASEWEDDPEHRADYEQQIILAADRFRARWGP